MKRKFSGKKGFTLVELIVVLVILAILAALLLPALTGYIDKAKKQAVTQELRLVAQASQAAYNELYAAGTITKNTDIDYIKDEKSKDPYDLEFGNLVRQYLSDDTIWDRVTGISIYLRGTAMGIGYQKDGTFYYYLRDQNGTVSIESY